MTKEDKIINTTKGEIKEVVHEVVMDALADFNVNFLEKTEKRLREDMKKSEQRVMDYTDKRVGELEGRVIPKINTLSDILEKKDIINKKDVRMVRKAGVLG